MWFLDCANKHGGAVRKAAVIRFISGVALIVAVAVFNLKGRMDKRIIEDAEKRVTQLQDSFTTNSGFTHRLEIENEQLKQSISQLSNEVREVTTDRDKILTLYWRPNIYFWWGRESFDNKQYPDAVQFLQTGIELSQMANPPSLQKQEYWPMYAASKLLTNQAGQGVDEFKKSLDNLVIENINNPTALGYIQHTLGTISNVVPPNVQPFVMTTITNVNYHRLHVP